MKQRVITALVLAPLAVAAVLWLPSALFLALISALLLTGLWEWTRLSGLQSVTARSLVLCVTAAVFAALAWQGWPQWFAPITWLGLAWWLFASGWVLRARAASAMAQTPRGVLLLCGLLLVIPAWTAAAQLHAVQPMGPAWLLYAVLVVWATDTAAYFVGSRIGGAKLAPRISPGKTWAGFWGGLGGGSLLALPAVPVFGLAWSQWPSLLLLSFLTACISVIGDLFESLVKRQRGAKDSGDLVPGHGGAMDRLDSLLAALPVFAALKPWLGL